MTGNTYLTQNTCQVINALRFGQKYYDTLYRSTVYVYKGVAVARIGNTLTTVYEGGVKIGRWILIK
jgi:hypothetical protein